MTTALLIVDIQNDYFEGGSNPLVDSLEACHNARRLLDAFRQAALPVFFIQHLSTRPGASFFIPGTPGAEIHPDLQPLPGEAIICKHFPNSFRETTLLESLRLAGVDRLVICGMMTHMCVDATARAAVDAGFSCRVAGDACASKDLVYAGQMVPAVQVHTAFLAALNGTYAAVTDTSRILTDLE
jgi:nicotinamidase-related amidase